jgi:hypothetical protein
MHIIYKGRWLYPIYLLLLLSPGTPYYAYYIQGAMHVLTLRINYKKLSNNKKREDFDKACFEFLLMNTLNGEGLQ